MRESRVNATGALNRRAYRRLCHRRSSHRPSSRYLDPCEVRRTDLSSDSPFMSVTGVYDIFVDIITHFASVAPAFRSEILSTFQDCAHADASLPCSCAFHAL